MSRASNAEMITMDIIGEVWRPVSDPSTTYQCHGTRGGHQTQVFERYPRRRQDLDEMIGELFLGGVSQARVGEVVETLTGTKTSASTVSRLFHSLESEYEQWKTPQLAERSIYAFADGTYFTVISNHESRKMPILAVVGITESGEREILAFRVGDRENE